MVTAQVKNPAVDLPIGIVGSLLVCGFLYALMCVVISLMVPYSRIDINAPFSEVPPSPLACLLVTVVYEYTRC